MTTRMYCVTGYWHFLASISHYFINFFVVCRIFSKSTFLKNSFRNTIWVSNRKDPDQTLNFSCCFFVVCRIFSKLNRLDPDQDLIVHVVFLLSAEFFQNQLFQKILSGKPSKCQTDWIQIRTNFSGCFFVVCRIFSKSTFSKNYFRNTIWVSNRLDPDHDLHFVGPDLGPNCLQKLSADDTSRQKIIITHADASGGTRSKIWYESSCVCKQRSLWQVCASVQAGLNLRCLPLPVSCAASYGSLKSFQLEF